MRYYELALVATPDLPEEGYQGLIENVDKLLKKKRKKVEKGEILNSNDWGVRKLSYPIRKESKGRYTILTIKCLPETLSEVERNLRLSEEILRYQSIRLKEEPVFEVPVPEEAKEPEKVETESAPEETKEPEKVETESAPEETKEPEKVKAESAPEEAKEPEAAAEEKEEKSEEAVEEGK